MGWGRIARATVLVPALGGLVALTACGTLTERANPASSPPPAAPVAPAAPVTPLVASPRAPAANGPSSGSARLAAYYADMQESLLARGYLRRDGGEVPLDATTLTRDFMLAAFYDETDSGARPADLRRWAKPVQIALQFGDSVDNAQRIRDRRTLANLARTLSQDTQLPVTVTTEAGDFIVFIVNEDERGTLAPKLMAELDGLSADEAARILDMPVSTYCAAYAYTEGTRSDYARAVALIRAEQPAVLRESCLHEEIAQGFGLANDSPLMRPSIFNDDEEFALLTPHDRALMRILYDPRLMPGMTAQQALPIVTLIAAEIAPPTS